MQASTAALAAGESDPAGQSLHAADPDTSLYFPGTHSRQDPPSGPVQPALQVQSLATLLPAGENVRTGQLLHVELDTAPMAPEYEPELQSVQASEPLTALYLPAWQSMQGSGYRPVLPGPHAEGNMAKGSQLGADIPGASVNAHDSSS